MRLHLNVSGRDVCGLRRLPLRRQDARPHRRSAGDASPAHTPCDGSQRAAAPARDTAAHGWFRRAAAVIAQPPPPPEPTGLAAILMPVSSALHALVTFYPWPFYLLMALKPHAKITRDLLAGARTLVPLALIYTLLLAASWSPDSLKLLLPGSFSQGVSNMLAGKFSVQFLPTVDSVGLLLSEPLAALSAWAHLQFISFFLARWIWMDGLVKKRATTHSILLCPFLPVLGFLSHLITCFVMSYLEGSDDTGDEDEGTERPASAQSSSSSSSACTVPPADSADVRAALGSDTSRNGISPTGSAAAVSSAGNLNLSTSAVTPSAPRGGTGAVPAADVADAAASAAPSFSGAAAAQGPNRESEGADARPAGRASAQVLEARVRALGPGEPGGGWRSWGGQAKPDWLTIEEPVFVRQNRALS